MKNKNRTAVALATFAASLTTLRFGLAGLFLTAVATLHAQEPPLLEIQRAPNAVELRWRTPADATQDRLSSFQVQTSDDMRQWSALGDPLRAASADELHLRSFSSDGARAFYRLLARYDAIAKSVLASGGADVFGYGPTFRAELAKIGLITPEQFAAKFPFPTNYLDHVSFDVTQAKFFDDFDAIVADAHTNPPCEVCGDPGSVLHEGLGYVNLAFIAAEFDGTPVMFAGPVLSHFEFELIGPPRRLADPEWKAP